MVELNNMTSGFMQVGVMQGWQCPVCKRVLSPSMMECPCRGQGMQTFTTTSTSTEEIKKEIASIPNTTITFTGSSSTLNTCGVQKEDATFYRNVIEYWMTNGNKCKITERERIYIYDELVNGNFKLLRNFILNKLDGKIIKYDDDKEYT